MMKIKLILMNKEIKINCYRNIVNYNYLFSIIKLFILFKFLFIKIQY